MSSQNALLASLAPDDRLALEPHLHAVTLGVGQDLALPQEPVLWIYFLHNGLASIVSESPGRKSIEVAMVGREGFVGMEPLLGAERALYRTFIQTAAEAVRIETGRVKEMFEANPRVRQALLGSIHALMGQAAESLIASCRYTLEQRLARWILMAHDRLESTDIPLTHGFLAAMLGVRRPGVTVALHVLEGEHAIRSNRGHVLIRDRRRLEEIAESAYPGAVSWSPGAAR